jgi:Uma2 family endonuclease
VAREVDPAAIWPLCPSSVETAASGAYSIGMSVALELRHVSVEDYLAGEFDSQVKHEYLGGFVYAMAGATIAHDRISANVVASLHAGLRGKPCQPHTSDMKIRVKLPTHVRFYYPDASVICESNPPHDSFQDRPAVIVEVLSKNTRRTDQGEKKDAYLTIPTLQAYLLIEQNCPAVSVYRRTDQGFVQEMYTELKAVVPLAEIETELPLSEIYERVEFMPEPEKEES